MPRHSFIQMSKLPNVKGRIFKAAQCQRANIVYYKPCKAGKSLCHLPHRRQHLLEQPCKGKPAGVSAQRRRGQMYRSKGTDYRLARNLYAIRAAAGTHGLYRGVPQAVRCGVRVRPPPQQAQDELSYPSDFQREETAPRT